MAEALVEYDYKAQELDELTIKKGDIITNISFKPGGWWEGTLLNGGKRGMFPDNFVKLIKPVEDGVSPTSASSGRRCKVLFPYSPTKDDELELQVGDVIDIISEVEEGWWKGSLKNKVGVFPSNFVAEITDAKPEKEAAQRKSKISRDESLKQSLGMNSGGSNSDNTSSLKSESPSELPVLPPKPAKEYCRVMYKYDANNPDELTLHRGDIITIITKEGQDPGWWKGELKGKIGVFPDNFVEMITLEEATKTELKTKMTNRLGMAISKSATTSSISDSLNLNLNSLSRKFSDTSKSSEEKIPPSVSKKPVLPPPPSKKPSPTAPSSKIIESTQSGLSSGKVVSSSTTTIKHGSSTITETSTVTSSSSKWTVGESGDSADGISWSKQSYSMKTDKKAMDSSTNSVTAVSMTESSSDLNLDMVGRSSTKLTHPTATRAKAPKRRPPSTLITKESPTSPSYFTFDLKNGDDEYDDDEESHEDCLVNGDADAHVEKPSSAPPWVEELKLNQAKKSLQNSIQGKTRVVIGMLSSASERSVSERTLSEKTVTEKTDKSVSEKTERAVAEKVVTEKAISPESRISSMVTLRQQPITGQRPQSMISNFRASSSPPLYPTLSSESITVSLKQWNDLLEKVSLLEANFESQIGTLTKAVKDLTGKLDDERQRRIVMQQELEKLTDLVTQV